MKFNSIMFVIGAVVFSSLIYMDYSDKHACERHGGVLVRAVYESPVCLDRTMIVNFKDIGK